MHNRLKGRLINDTRRTSVEKIKRAISLVPFSFRNPFSRFRKKVFLSSSIKGNNEEKGKMVIIKLILINRDFATDETRRNDTVVDVRK